MFWQLHAAGAGGMRLRKLPVWLAGFVDEKHNFPGSIAAYCSDGAGIVIGSLMGSSPITVFVGVPHSTFNKSWKISASSRRKGACARMHCRGRQISSVRT